MVFHGKNQSPDSLGLDVNDSMFVSMDAAFINKIIEEIALDKAQSILLN